MWGCVSNSFNYELCCYQYLTNIVLGDYSEGKIKCRNACHGHEKWGTNKRYKRFEGTRPLEEHGPEWEDNIKFVCLLTVEFASDRNSLIYSIYFKRRCSF